MYHHVLFRFRPKVHFGKKFWYDHTYEFNSMYTRADDTGEEILQIDDFDNLKQTIEKEKSQAFVNCFVNRWILHESEIVPPISLPNLETYEQPMCPYKSLYEQDIRGLHEVHLKTPDEPPPNTSPPTPWSLEDDDLDLAQPERAEDQDNRAAVHDEL